MKFLIGFLGLVLSGCAGQYLTSSRSKSTLYALDKGTKDNLQWVGRFELTNPGNIDKVSSKYARELTEALLKESIASPME